MSSLLISLLAVGALHISQGSRSAEDSAGFVTLLGRDTVALESFRRTASQLQGEIVIRVPGTVLLRYTLDLRKDGTVSRSVVELKPLGVPDMVGRRVTIDFLPSFARATIDSAGAHLQQRQPLPPGSVPLLMSGFGSSFGIYSSLGMYELLLSHLSFPPTATMTVPAIGAVDVGMGTRQFIRRSATQVDADYFKIAWTHLTLDEHGRIMSADASETTERTQTWRTGPIDVARAAREFAARDRAGKGVGIASPADSVRAKLGAATIAIDYSSPRRRERRILGKVVPYDQVWRTGANAATVLLLDHAVTIGEQVVPAGEYTLWTLPKTTGVELIINRQHGQWGTDYDASQDLGHIPMVVSTAPTPQDNFAIVVHGEGGAGELRIQWDTFVWSVPLTVR